MTGPDAEPQLNPYATPQATVADAPVVATGETFFPVTVLKLTVMSVATFNLPVLLVL